MPATISYQGKTYTSEPDETVLDTLLRNGEPVPNSCRAGACQACMMKAAPNTPPTPASQAGLREPLKRAGYFLSCQCKPEGDMEIAEDTDNPWHEAVIERLVLLTSNVMKVILRPAEIDGFAYEAGQYIQLMNPVDELEAIRSYSLASVPAAGNLLELHIRNTPGGRMSTWLFEQAAVGDAVKFRGPAGECYYMAQKDQPILLAGTGTGLAPLWGILQDALERGHEGPIVLMHGARVPEGLYLVNELRALGKERTEQIKYLPVCLEAGDEPAEDIVIGGIDGAMSQHCPKLAGWKVYLCGDPGIVKVLRKKAFLSGAAMKDIHADAFLPGVAASSK